MTVHQMQHGSSRCPEWRPWLASNEWAHRAPTGAIVSLVVIFIKGATSTV